MFGLKNGVRTGTILLCGLLPLGATVGYGQGTAWAPSRSATRPGSAALTQSYDAPLPDWQRAPNAPEVRATSHDSYSSSQPSSARTTQGRPTFTARSTSGRTSNHQRLAYDVQLGPGEQLVGQPTMSDEKPMGSTGGKAPAEFVPTPDGVSGGRTTPRGEIIHEGPHRGQHHDGEMHLDPGFDYENGNYISEDEMGGDCDSCADGNCRSCTSGMCRFDEWGDPTRCPDCGYYGYHRPGCGRVAMCLQNCVGPLIREWSIFAGSQGVKGPLDGGVNGNFGFNEGVNFAGPIIPWPRCGLGYQMGARWTQSNLSGSPFGTSSREQVFLTAGLFHRAYRGCGFQWGVAYDWLSDNYNTNDTYAQMRTEFSFLGKRGHELGFLGMFGVKNSNPAGTIQQADQYNLFYRYTTAEGSQGRIWGGLTDKNLGIFGCDYRVPMSNRFDLVGGFNYIIPNDTTPAMGVGGSTQESWGLAMNLVFYVGRPKAGIHNTPFRPLFNVADNNVLMMQQQ